MFIFFKNIPNNYPFRPEFQKGGVKEENVSNLNQKNLENLTNEPNTQSSSLKRSSGQEGLAENLLLNFSSNSDKNQLEITTSVEKKLGPWSALLPPPTMLEVFKNLSTPLNKKKQQNPITLNTDKQVNIFQWNNIGSPSNAYVGPAAAALPVHGRAAAAAAGPLIIKPIMHCPIKIFEDLSTEL